jgi:flagellar basal-body rod protein FlgG
MDASMWVAKTGLSAQSTRMTVIANNLANVNTTGFKKDRAMFEDLLYQRIVQAGAQADINSETPTGLMLGTGTRVVATEKVHRQGSGFFAVQQADGTTAYTRDGSLKLSNTGEIVTASGESLIPAITIPQDAASVTIGRDGTITVELAAGGGAANVGQFQLTRFVNPAGLTPLGRNLFARTNSSGDPIVGIPGAQGAGMITQGALEASNVNVVEEMVNMIETQRAYEINSKAIAATDGMLRFLNNNL